MQRNYVEADGHVKIIVAMLGDNTRRIYHV